MHLPRPSAAPFDVTPNQRKNFINVQIDAIGVGLANAASPFLPVFLTRLGASNFEVSLLSSMPGVTGLFFSILLGWFLQTRRNIVPWFSSARLLVISSYAATGLAPFLVPENYLVVVILGIWAIATLPQTAVAIGFSVVMNAVAGPNHRYDLMSRRWTILGMVTALTTAVAGQVLESLRFPINYQVVFVGLSLGGLISFYYSSHIDISEEQAAIKPQPKERSSQANNMVRVVLGRPDFLVFAIKRFVFMSGTSLALPLFPLYYVREVRANDAWIGMINTAQTMVLVIAYTIWVSQSRRRGSRFVLLAATLGLSIYPVSIALTQNVQLIAVFAGLAGFFVAGLDLVFFDELMKTVPPEHSATFVSVAQSLQYLATIFAPMIGSWLGTHIGLGNALIVSGTIRLVGFLLFAFWNPRFIVRNSL